jgi:hypothetical protein
MRRESSRNPLESLFYKGLAFCVGAYFERWPASSG